MTEKDMQPTEPAPAKPRPPKDRPGIKIVPPKAAAVAVAAGIVLNFLIPLNFFSFWTAFFIGFLLFILGALVVAWALYVMDAKSTSFRIDRPATTLLKGGPYSFSRNPIYVGGAVACAGIGLMFNSGWVLLFLIPLMVVIHKRVVLPEEAYLERTFGTDYLDYKEHVSRWL